MNGDIAMYPYLPICTRLEVMILSIDTKVVFIMLTSAKEYFMMIHNVMFHNEINVF
jgi:hypothetical protein